MTITIDITDNEAAILARHHGDIGAYLTQEAQRSAAHWRREEEDPNYWQRPEYREKVQESAAFIAGVLEGGKSA